MTAVATQEIPLVDLKAQYATIRDEVRAAIDEVLESMQLTIGPNVKAFDQEFASYIGTKHSIGVGSGTDALQLAIRACGVSSGDEVITVSHTFFATVEAILYANARPILVEVDEKTMNMDAAAVAAAITPRTKAIIPVHLYGRTVDLKPLRRQEGRLRWPRELLLVLLLEEPRRVRRGREHHDERRSAGGGAPCAPRARTVDALLPPSGRI